MWSPSYWWKGQGLWVAYKNTALERRVLSLTLICCRNWQWPQYIPLMMQFLIKREVLVSPWWILLPLLINHHILFSVRTSEIHLKKKKTHHEEWEECFLNLCGLCMFSFKYKLFMWGYSGRSPHPAVFFKFFFVFLPPQSRENGRGCQKHKIKYREGQQWLHRLTKTDGRKSQSVKVCLHFLPRTPLFKFIFTTNSRLFPVLWNSICSLHDFVGFFFKYYIFYT